MGKVAILGAGAMGLTSAYYAMLAGHEVVVYEADDVVGGMAAHFDFDGLSIERYYHFICKTDVATFELLSELGIEDKLNWTDTKMGYYIDGELYPWGDPISLLKFPLLTLFQKMRYALSALWQTKRNNFDSIENKTAKEWIVRDCGEKVYDLLWRRLFDLKFYEYANDISAAWIATRVKRIGLSRRTLFQESLGYLEGGTESLISTLADKILEGGGRILVNEPALEILVSSVDGSVDSVRSKSGCETFDHVISTVPLPLIDSLVKMLTPEEMNGYQSINNIGVICVVFKLAKPLSDKFWININDPRIEIPGVVEFSNLRPVDGNIVYVPYYMPVTNHKFAWSDAEIIDEAWSYLQFINTDLKASDKIAATASRLRYGQPICEPGFYEKIMPIQTSVIGLQVADTSYYYPEDRGISESVKLGKQLAKNLNE